MKRDGLKSTEKVLGTSAKSLERLRGLSGLVEQAQNRTAEQLAKSGRANLQVGPGTSSASRKPNNSLA